LRRISVSELLRSPTDGAGGFLPGVPLSMGDNTTTAEAFRGSDEASGLMTEVIGRLRLAQPGLYSRECRRDAFPRWSGGCTRHWGSLLCGVPPTRFPSPHRDQFTDVGAELLRRSLDRFVGICRDDLAHLPGPSAIEVPDEPHRRLAVGIVVVGASYRQIGRAGGAPQCGPFRACSPNAPRMPSWQLSEVHRSCSRGGREGGNCPKAAVSPSV
jgi:hypothetical protein